MATKAKAKKQVAAKTKQQLKDKAKAAAARAKALDTYRNSRGAKFPCGDVLGEDGSNVQFSVERSRDAGAPTWLRLRCLKCNREAAAKAMAAHRKALKRAKRAGAAKSASKTTAELKAAVNAAKVK